MEVTGVWGVSLAALQRAVRTVEPAALLVPGRILRRIIKQDRSIPGAGLTVPHRKTYVVARERMFASADRIELGLGQHEPVAERVLLIAEPEAEKLALMTRSRALVKYWRLLFHARLDAELADRVASGRLNETVVRQRIEQIGRAAFSEIRSVLERDDWLLPPIDDVTVYCEFVAVYAESRHFAPRLVADYFPSLEDLATIDAFVAEDVDTHLLFEQTRLHGAPRPHEAALVDDEEWAEADRPEPAPVPPQLQSERRYCKLMERADRARDRGNLVRSAILCMRATEVIGPKLARVARDEARSDMHRLAGRLRDALDLDNEQQREWSVALNELLAHVGHGLWVVEGRLLYDLQKVCIDHERGVFALDLIRWTASLGQESIKRPLPNQGSVLMARHLAAAGDRLGAARLTPEHRQRLSRLLSAAVARAEEKMRLTLRPLIASALDEVHLNATNVPERVARAKLIEELLDTIARRGFLTMGNLRDAVSRNQLKIADVVSWTDVRHGDQLLQADRRLSTLLDGVYRGGEAYLRLPQRLSSLAFGTEHGRFLTRYLFVPFGGAFLILEFLKHLLHMVAGWVSRPVEPPTAPVHEGPAFELLPTLLLGSFLCALLHHAGFRQWVAERLGAAWENARWAAFELPRRLRHLPLVQAVIESPAFLWFERFAVKPLVFTFLLLMALRLVSSESASWFGRLALFVAINLLLNSRIGRDVDEVVTDWVVRGWRQFRVRVIAAFFQLIVDTFSQLLESLERLLYTVDEWLRFRAGENQLSTVTKSVLGVVWFGVTYVVRFCVTLLIEPQINPIKHFPVVTVSHKIMLPFIPTLAGILEQHFGWGTKEAASYASLIILGIPGIFGFLVWELKENWRIFAANRRERLEPVMIGDHGETMPRLLRAGFHSGTVPKLFDRLRRADRKAYATGRWSPPRKYRDQLQHVADAVRHGVEREVISVLEQSGRWPAGQLHVSDVRLGVNSIRVALRTTAHAKAAHGSAIDDMATDDLWIETQERETWLLGRMTKPDWLLNVPHAQLQALNQAVTGWFHLCGVELVDEELAAAVMPPAVGYDITPRGLLVWLDEDFRNEAVYNLLRGGPEVFPVGSTEACNRLRPLDPGALDFAAHTLTWAEWLAIWNEPPPAIADPAPQHAA